MEEKIINVVAIKSDDTRLGYNLYTRQWVEKHILAGRMWRMQLTETDNKTVKEDSHIYYEGNDPEAIMDELERNGYWGVWALTEQKQESDGILDTFFANEPPRQIIIFRVRVTGD